MMHSSFKCVDIVATMTFVVVGGDDESRRSVIILVV